MFQTSYFVLFNIHIIHRCILNYRIKIKIEPLISLLNSLYIQIINASFLKFEHRTMKQSMIYSTDKKRIKNNHKRVQNTYVCIYILINPSSKSLISFPSVYFTPSSIHPRFKTFITEISIQLPILYRVRL